MGIGHMSLFSKNLTASCFENVRNTSKDFYPYFHKICQKYSDCFVVVLNGHHFMLSANAHHLHYHSTYSTYKLFHWDGY